MGWGAGESQAQPAFLVKDINTTVPRASSAGNMTPLAVVGDNVFFAGDDGANGLELWKVDTLTGSATMVKDIFPGQGSSLHSLLMTTANGLVFFAASDGVHGSELWKSDGTAAGTVMIRDLDPSPYTFAIGRWIASAGGLVFFGGDDGSSGQEVWVTDGTSAGTKLLADIHPGSQGSNTAFLATAGGKVLFAADDGTHGLEPWISDGTEAGTHRVRDIHPGVGASITLPFFQARESALGMPDGSFLIGVTDGAAHGNELWRTDGTEAGTTLVADIVPGAGSSTPTRFALLNGKAYFSASTAAAGEELWSSDGTAAGTALVKDIVPGTQGSFPSLLTPVDGQLFFQADSRLWKSDGTAAGTVFVHDALPGLIAPLGSSVAGLSNPYFPDDLLLWKSDGTEEGTVLVKDFGPQTSAYQGLFGLWAPVEAEGELYFYTGEPGVGQGLWKTDGTLAGTVPVQRPAARTPSLHGGTLMAPQSNGLLFAANDGTTSQIWRTNGTPGGTQPVPGAPAGDWPNFPGSSSSSWSLLGDTLVYVAPNSPALWKTDGTAAGTESLLPTGISIDLLWPAGDRIFFWRSTPETGVALWKTDGTVAGTALVKDIVPGPGSGPSTIGTIGTLGSLLLFASDDGTTGRELWRSDGTEAGTFLVKDFRPGLLSSGVSYAATLGGVVILIARDESGNQKLWKTDGTPEGTELLKDLPQGPSSERFLSFSFTKAGNLVYFPADDGIHGWELWVSDGTEAGTRLVEDIHPGASSSSIETFVAVGNRVFFAADDGVHGRELWVSDGTEAGTYRVEDIHPGVSSSQGIQLSGVAFQGRLLFTADDGAHGRDLWVSDGTEAGTHLLKDLPLAPYGPLRALEHAVVFTASDGVHGYELWVSDGTGAGTRMFQDIAPGALSSFPERVTVASARIYFLADDGTGTELWAFPAKALNPTFTDVPSNYWAWGFVEALASAGITTGCAPGLYCPVSQVTRAEMAVFLGRGIHGGSFVPPPATGTVFTDVPASYWAAAWIEQFAADGITTGCAPSRYCPDALVNRSEMAVFLLRSKHGAAYTPPPATGTVFTDVPASYWAAAWIEQLAAEGITTGCAPNQYCPGSSVSRDQMAAFLTRTFNLATP